MTPDPDQGVRKLPRRSTLISKSASLPWSKLPCSVFEATGRRRLWKFLLYLERNKLEDINSIKLNSNTDLVSRQHKLIKK